MLRPATTEKGLAPDSAKENDQPLALLKKRQPPYSITATFDKKSNLDPINSGLGSAIRSEQN
jgi:hypothetical protein